MYRQNIFKNTNVFLNNESLSIIRITQYPRSWYIIYKYGINECDAKKLIWYLL